MWTKFGQIWLKLVWFWAQVNIRYNSSCPPKTISVKQSVEQSQSSKHVVTITGPN
jgi:hypothetical protein